MFVLDWLVRYLSAHFGNDPNFTAKYNTRALFVDGENNTVLVRPVNDPSSAMIPLEYDILLGCDGIRSIVRNAFVTHHRDFEFDIQGAFGTGKSVHLTFPQSVGEGHFMFLLKCLPNFLCTSRTRKKTQLWLWLELESNRRLGPVFQRSSSGRSLCSRTFQKSLKWITRNSPNNGRNNPSNPHKWPVAIFTTATRQRAHATVPDIGQGKNTALPDAALLNRLLDRQKDNWDQVLPAFSEERVRREMP
jgi:hypothetical protein